MSAGESLILAWIWIFLGEWKLSRGNRWGHVYIYVALAYVIVIHVLVGESL